MVEAGTEAGREAGLALPRPGPRPGWSPARLGVGLEAGQSGVVFALSPLLPPLPCVRLGWLRLLDFIGISPRLRPRQRKAGLPAEVAGLQPGLGPGLGQPRPATLQSRPASIPALNPAKPASRGCPLDPSHLPPFEVKHINRHLPLQI